MLSSASFKTGNLNSLRGTNLDGTVKETQNITFILLVKYMLYFSPLLFW
jgi:hypothetical protein